ncbi:hypothetical protein KJY73_00345 [Bowmanella sp. Y26]|uniref:DUF6776 family protein n=1 Tax=Bowmanella yangjiangensis TaxID=2811230 RepID=UPI001BDD9FA7|nr:DUF6776 family protein [Bowmanella yangjiangensis]MBT1061992.1 hypothetical protein [Bowmanella yangjiangensis]
MLLSPKALKTKLGAMRFYWLMIALLVLVGYLGIRWGNHQYEYQARQIEALEQSLANVTAENNKLTKSLNILGVELEVERLASQQMQGSLTQSMQKQAEIRRELSFYQKVMAPEMQEQGVVVDSLDIEATNSPGYFRFALVMMQKDKRKDLVQGQAQVVIHGSKDGTPSQLVLTDLMGDDSKPLGFRFRYFEVLEGLFQLPEGFIPQRLEVDCSLTKPKKGEQKRSFEWLLSVSETAELNS